MIPIILSGGSGTRLWPLSRRSKPKQFLSFTGGKSLFQETVLRCAGAPFDPRPIIAGADDHRFLIAGELLEIGVDADILLEPVARNSCAAIALACFQAIDRDAEAVVLVLASDHAISDAAASRRSAEKAASLAEAGRLVTFGVRPTRPATGYGYIKAGDIVGDGFRIAQFVEKPDPATAERCLAEGYLWNSGNFLFRASVFLDELAALAPDIHAAVAKAFAERHRDLDFIRVGEEAFAASPSISVDYAVMEKTARAAVFPIDYFWSDVGTWDAVGEANPGDEAGNTTLGDVALQESAGNVVYSDGRLTAMVGVRNLVVVSTRDAVLVADRNQAESVKTLVDFLQQSGRSEAVEALQNFRPWGYYEQLDASEGYQVKRIVLKPGGILSLQMHRYRAEHWVVVSGEAEVTVDGTVKTVRANGSVDIPLGAVHRLANRGGEPLVLIEIQTGTYFGEDDIIRLEDTYNRSK
ncbi:MAG: mannose-1-phosphate guanylyltransferase/mannose-6-phosphate isomerase [Hyphomicrobiales bacterium]|nr:mannose-1-phosphate guanylyltransferase/mannose-6-phosphate isomerase [Hyphomicrobiales bacterium]